MNSHTEVPPGKRVIWRSSMMVNGTRIYARQYGKRAFRIVIDD